MKKTRLTIIIASAIVLLLAFGVAADEKKGKQKEVTLQGEVLDMACYISHGAKGPDHAACAKKCAKAGQPMGLLTKDGKVYILFGGHDDATAFEKTKDFAGQNVKITGLEFEKDGIKGITVKSVKSL